MNWQQLISNKRLGQEERHALRHDDRSEFKRDSDRLIYSAPFRRLQNKTQVFPLPGSVFVHNRLTHSLEVASLGKSLGDDVARRLIPTGLHIALPIGFEAQVRPRSGLALKHGLTVLNSPGTIDADYRGEIMVLLINFSDEPFTINDGERIAQMVIARHEQADFVEVEELDETERGEGGYGHTGVK